MPDKYYLVESGALEKLLRTHFMLTQSTLLFEHLLSHSDRPMFLSRPARSARCWVWTVTSSNNAAKSG